MIRWKFWKSRKSREFDNFCRKMESADKINAAMDDYVDYAPSDEREFRRIINAYAMFGKNQTCVDEMVKFIKTGERTPIEELEEALT